MRAMLINPPAAAGVNMVREGRCMQRAGAWTAVWAPISLATIAAVLSREGISCRLDDCIIEGVSAAGVLARAVEFKPDLIVINTATPSIESDLGLATILKAELPNAVILAFGIHVSALPRDSLALAPGLDAVVIGEPELTVRDAALAIRDKKPITGIPGIGVRGRQKNPAPEREFADLDALPLPAWDLVKTDLYRLPFTGRPFLLVGTSRGCPHSCRFCADAAYYGRHLRMKSPERIVAELKTCRDKHQVSDFLFWSESFTLRREWTQAVLEEIIRADLGIRFVCNSRTDHVDPDLLALLRRAGGWMIGFGLESGSQHILDLMGKNVSLEQNRQAVLWAKEAGLQVTAHMVLGYPGETAETIAETIRFSRSLPLDYAQFYCAVPFPGSRMFQLCLDQELFIDEPWEKFEQNFSIINTPELSAAEVMAWRSRAFRSFYLRPARVWRVMRHEVGLRGLPRFLRMMWDFKEWA